MSDGFFRPDRRPDRWKQVKGGWRCGLCSITYPNDRDRFMRCPACHEACVYMSNVMVDADWADQITDNVLRWEGGADDKVPIEWLLPPEKKEEGEGEA